MAHQVARHQPHVFVVQLMDAVLLLCFCLFGFLFSLLFICCLSAEVMVTPLRLRKQHQSQCHIGLFPSEIYCYLPFLIDLELGPPDLLDLVLRALWPLRPSEPIQR